MSKQVADISVETLQAADVINIHFALRVETHLAVASFKAKQVAEALKCFGGIVSAFARVGIYQTILDLDEGGAEVGPLIATFQENVEQTVRSQELMSDVSKLMAAWRSRYQSEPQQAPAPIAASAISEALSAREGDILKMIAEGLSNKEIARSLAITPETVKSHVKHIFTKLNVEKRAQAVSRAQILGLTGTLQ